MTVGTNATPNEKMTEFLTDQLKRAGDELQRFQKEFAANPIRALGWAGTTYSAAARMDVYGRLLPGLTAPDAAPDHALLIAEEARDEVVWAARFPARSTSPYSNCMEQERAAAWGDLANFARWNLAVKSSEVG